MSFIRRLNKINVITGIFAILFGGLISYFSIQDYMDLKDIKKSGREVKVKVLSKSYVNKIHSMDVLFQGETYYVKGGSNDYKKGEIIKLIYSEEKDKFLYGYTEGHYSYIFVFLGMIIIGIATLFMAFFEAWKPFSKSSD